MRLFFKNDKHLNNLNILHSCFILEKKIPSMIALIYVYVHRFLYYLFVLQEFIQVPIIDII